MAVEVKVTATLQRLVGSRTVTAEGATVGDVLDNLDARYQGFKEQVADNGQMRRFVNIFLNDEDIRFLQELATPVKDGDVVSILPAMSGGC
jgi:molybdopterin synthase sulfur carrier subunit